MQKYTGKTTGSRSWLVSKEIQSRLVGKEVSRLGSEAVEVLVTVLMESSTSSPAKSNLAHENRRYRPDPCCVYVGCSSRIL
jgi:hypothetical protein